MLSWLSRYPDLGPWLSVLCLFQGFWINEERLQIATGTQSPWARCTGSQLMVIIAVTVYGRFLSMNKPKMNDVTILIEQPQYYNTII